MAASRDGSAGFVLLMGEFLGLWTGILALSILRAHAPSGPTLALLGQHYLWQAVALLGGAFVLGSPGSTLFRLDCPLQVACLVSERSCGILTVHHTCNSHPVGRRSRSQMVSPFLSFGRADGECLSPSALEKGIRSERALKLAVAEMCVQGVSTLKIATIIEDRCGVIRLSRCHEQSRRPGKHSITGAIPRLSIVRSNNDVFAGPAGRGDPEHFAKVADAQLAALKGLEYAQTIRVCEDPKGISLHG